MYWGGMMTSIVNYAYNKEGVKQIAEWPFGKNWPIVYIVYNDKKAYVGESLDAVRRTEQHLQEPEFNDFSQICLISDKSYNKSVVLDLESFLIKYISADGSKELTNSNAGILNHNYFYKEAYEDDFREIWNGLISRGIVQKSLIDIENSELFKYSPYKSLNAEQQKAAYEILNGIFHINNLTSQSIITVEGGAGTGKTILAVYLVKLLADVKNNKRIWHTIDDPEDAILVQKICKELAGIRHIGLVVPMKQLRTTMRTIFNSIDGLSESMVLAPEDIVNQRYDVLIVDEAHRLYRRKNLPGQNITPKFDRINQKLMGEAITYSEQDDTELDWIIKNSRIQVLFYDEFQTIRVADIGRERFRSICKPYLYKTIELYSQMRCKGGNGYYEYIKAILEETNFPIQEYKKISNYELCVVDSVDSLFSIIHSKQTNDSLCRVIAGPGWTKKESIVIDGQSFQWASKTANSKDSILSIHMIQGFDLNYAGVIFGKEIYYDEEKGRIDINKQELRDNFTKSNGDDNMRRYVINIYITLMTRGIDGTFVYTVDKPLREYLKKFLR